MALFSGSDAKAPDHPPVTEGSLSIVARGTRIVGDVVSDGVLKIEGEIKGAVRAGRQVLVGKGGKLEGDLFSREAIVGGEVHGSITADERVELQASCLVVGDITGKRILMEEGSRVNGVLHMGDPATMSQAARPAVSERRFEAAKSAAPAQHAAPAHEP